jgi:hypothetical protein
VAFRRGLSEYDLVEGKNVASEWRRAGPEYERFRELTAELRSLSGTARDGSARSANSGHHALSPEQVRPAKVRVGPR